MQYCSFIEKGFRSRQHTWRAGLLSACCSFNIEQRTAPRPAAELLRALSAANSNAQCNTDEADVGLVEEDDEALAAHERLDRLYRDDTIIEEKRRALQPQKPIPDMPRERSDQPRPPEALEGSAQVSAPMAAR